MNDHQEIDMSDLSNAESVGATESTLGAAGGSFMEGIRWVYREESEY